MAINAQEAYRHLFILQAPGAFASECSHEVLCMPDMPGMSLADLAVFFVFSLNLAASASFHIFSSSFSLHEPQRLQRTAMGAEGDESAEALRQA